MFFSIVTAVYNRRDTIADTIRSLQAQTWPDFEHIIVDGASTDGTLEVVERMRDSRTKLISEPDKGIYDAINKGIALATGDILGLAHSDDHYASESVLELVASAFDSYACDAVYGDLQYVSETDADKVIRNWKSSTFNTAKLKNGWMPPHPTLFLKRPHTGKYPEYDLSYSIASDYEFILRQFSQDTFMPIHVPHVLVKMRAGGASNRSIKNIVRKTTEDYRAISSHGIGGLRTLLAKNFSKISQFFYV